MSTHVLDTAENVWSFLSYYTRREIIIRRYRRLTRCWITKNFSRGNLLCIDVRTCPWIVQQFWGPRKKISKSMKYIRYMLNDHFLIVLFSYLSALSWCNTRVGSVIRVLEWPTRNLLAFYWRVFRSFGGSSSIAWTQPDGDLFIHVGQRL